MKTFKVAEATRRLFVVATPIGNMDELSPRARHALGTAEIIFCEDTRVTGKLLSMLGLKKRMISIGTVDERKALPKVASFFDSAACIALVSDAGYPGLSDPGTAVIQKAYEKNWAVEVVNGPSCLMHALVASGFWLSDFFYAGFMPARPKERISKIKELVSLKGVVVFFEAPHRILSCLQDLAAAAPERETVVCREMTKLHETIYRGFAAELCKEILPKGEFVVVVGPQPISRVGAAPDFAFEPSLDEALKQVEALVQSGTRPKEACSLISKVFHWKTSDLYNAFIKRKR